ncbi:MAG: hypothetical protein HOP12_06925 [Candidatus Eisenbacteria bacterium]|uniref:DAHL domain-containing protein n=1 Tax=Eiseniibacteriota bacterium TaxID=2212470 RepID=A0A849SH54_UNCEI|nr:hypothetical protein [Candidatus Eisenbacteria bacterium]
MTRALFRLLALLGGVLLGLVVLDRTFAVDSNLYRSVSEDLARLSTLDAQLDQDVLRSRLHILAHYDPLVAAEVEIRAIHERLLTPPPYLSAAGRAG